MANIKDLSGKIFGRLTVIRRMSEKRGSCFLYLCKCTCGRDKLVPTNMLTSGLTRSCGCLGMESREVELTGKRFGRLTVVKPTGRIKHHNRVWECLCDCGNTTHATTSNLQSGYTMSCGCLHRDMALERSKTVRDNNLVDGTNLGNIRLNRIPAHNTSGCRGVSWHKGVGMWQARIQFQGIKYQLGSYVDINKAIEARKEAEDKYFKPYLRSKN